MLSESASNVIANHQKSVAGVESLEWPLDLEAIQATAYEPIGVYGSSVLS
jgi:hypothetical protein